MVALGRLRPENCKFKGNLGYIANPCLKKKKKTIKMVKSHGLGKEWAVSAYW